MEAYTMSKFIESGWSDASDSDLIVYRCTGYILRAVMSPDGKWLVYTEGTNHLDGMGKVGIRVVVCEDGKVVYDTGGDEPDGLVYSPVLIHDLDSDETLNSCIQLVCHDATHDRNDNPITPAWDADGLAEEAAMVGVED